MVLNDNEILQLCQDTGVELIKDFNKENIFNCGYNLRVGQIYEPGTGTELIDPAKSGFAYKIPPNGTAIIRTKEKVKLPNNMCATYSSPFKLAKEGLLLLNACMVEPGYEGYLSCYFVNLSSSAFCFSQNQNIAKIVFLKLTNTPSTQKSQKISDDEYRSILFQQSNKFQSSFLDINRIEERAVEKATKSIQSSIKWGGLLIGFLLLFATLEPLITKWIWGNSAVFDKKVETLEKQLIRNSHIISSSEEKQKIIDSLYKIKTELLIKQIDSLRK